jgi:hypothetical protein
MNEMIQVPILKDFDYNRVIGYLSINKSDLPPIPDYVFSIGYRLNPESNNYELICVSPVFKTNIEGEFFPNG